MQQAAKTESRNIPALLHARQSPAITARLRSACVGIAGCGGLGSVVAEELARAGVGTLIIADCDKVEPSNLNRQRYTLGQIGMPKTAALAENLAAACPLTAVVPVQTRVAVENCAEIFRSCSVVAECFDDPSAKASLAMGIRAGLPSCTVVAASGVAGIGRSDLIRTVRISDKLYLVGDLQTEPEGSEGLFASRVGIVASCQAHLIIRLIAGAEK